MLPSSLHPLPLTYAHAEPQMHLFFTGVGFYLGYLAHRYEENSEERTKLLLAKYRHAPREWAEMVKPNEGRHQLEQQGV